MDAPRDQHDRTEQPGVVVGVDGTSTALRAVEWAAAEARLRGTGLQILHAAPYATGPSPDLGRQRADEILARAYTVAHRAEPEVPARTHATAETAGAGPAQRVHTGRAAGPRNGRSRPVGGPDHRIDRTGRQRTGRLPGNHRPWAPSSTRHRPTGPGRRGRRGEQYRRAELRLRRRPTARRSDRGAARPSRGGADLRSRLRHRADRPLSRHRPAGQGARPVDSCLPRRSLKLDVVVGHPSATLLAAAAHARLVVVGSRGRSAPARALFGSTSRELLRRCPSRSSW